MREIEVKILDIDQKATEKKLVELGAEKVFEGIIEGDFFDLKDGPLRKKGKTLRLRKENEQAVLTFKKPIPDKNLKVREELEVKVSDFQEAREILKSLGFSVWLSIKKKRVSYKKEGVRFEIDKHLAQFKFVPVFLEIEAKNPKNVYKYVELLGFRKEDCKPWTIRDIVEHMHECKKKSGK